ncbi:MULTISPECIES: hypothetical protein, partial [unclassified Bradyrhizobium]|uniref:hypothetical protein n=1 Tax=unclassified Bradyrhizobium TaxID=2631580 RepID=UPI002916B1DB
PVRGDYRRCQAETPLIVLSRFPGPAHSFNRFSLVPDLDVREEQGDEGQSAPDVFHPDPYGRAQSKVGSKDKVKQCQRSQGEDYQIYDEKHVVAF